MLTANIEATIEVRKEGSGGRIYKSKICWQFQSRVRLSDTANHDKRDSFI
jgi:hypothetical protein